MATNKGDIMDQIILNTSDEAAKFITGISGWVSRSGRFWGNDEHMARWDGCTHVVCECGNSSEKGYTKCEMCRKKAKTVEFDNLPRKEWDEKTPIVLYDGDEYFFSRDELDEWCEEHDTTPGRVQLLICEPNHAWEIDDDFYCDALPEDQSLEDVAPELAEKISEINRYIREKRPVLSWGPSNIAAIIK